MTITNTMPKKQKEKTARESKQEEIASLVEKIKSAKTIVFSDYQGLSAEDMNLLRRKIKAVGGELLITKNSLMKIALTRNKFPVASDKLLGATATLFAFDDELAPLKEIADKVKSAGIPKYKFGFFGKNLLEVSKIEELSKIPPRAELHAKVVGSLASPIHGIVGVLAGNLRNLVYALEQITRQKEVTG